MVCWLIIYHPQIYSKRDGFTYSTGWVEPLCFTGSNQGAHFSNYQRLSTIFDPHGPFAGSVSSISSTGHVAPQLNEVISGFNNRITRLNQQTIQETKGD